LGEFEDSAKQIFHLKVTVLRIGGSLKGMIIESLLKFEEFCGKIATQTHFL
jgi:hypothetical protein